MFLLGANEVTNDEYARHIAALGPNRFAVMTPYPMAKTPRILAIGSDAEEVKKTVESMPVRELFPEAGDATSLGAMRAFAGALVPLEIGDFGPRCGFDRPRQPAGNVNWNEAMIYALLHGCILPTEWQWEYAARVATGGVLREYATPSGKLNHREAHYAGQAPVDVDDPRYPSLENGLRHMTGNMWEWMANWHGQYPEGPVVDPTGPEGGQYRALRGGSWYGGVPRILRAAFRYDDDPVGRFGNIGFRLAAAPRTS
jgi:formylglycine-generating enzyme required for sulfatase activity